MRADSARIAVIASSADALGRVAPSPAAACTVSSPAAAATVSSAVSASNIARSAVSVSSSRLACTRPLLANHCSNFMLEASKKDSVAPATMRADVVSSAPKGTKDTSPSTDCRATYSGPVNVRPLACAVSPLSTNTIRLTDAPIDACHGNPASAASTTSRE